MFVRTYKIIDPPKGNINKTYNELFYNKSKCMRVLYPSQVIAIYRLIKTKQIEIVYKHEENCTYANAMIDDSIQSDFLKLI